MGTSFGNLLIFDHFQNLLKILGAKEGVTFGAVSTIDMSAQNDSIIAGHLSGKVVLWDFETGIIAALSLLHCHCIRFSIFNITTFDYLFTFLLGQLLKIMEDHKAPICATLFVDNTSYTILSADTVGIVNWTVFRKVFYYYIASTKTIIGLGYNNLPKYGFTRDLAFLKPTGFHRCDNYHLFAFASEKKVVIVSCQNSDSPFFYELTPPPNTPLSAPLLSWRKVFLPF